MSTDTSAPSPASTLVNNTPLRSHKLSVKQERNLLDFIDERLLDITRNFKKRHHPSTTLPTLQSYLDAMHPLLSVILQIPPVVPQLTLRTALLLRLTGEFLGSVIGYPPDPDTLPAFANWLDDLDRGWVAVLRSQVWDPAEHEGVDIDLSVNDRTDTHSQLSVDADFHLPGAVNQTDRTRLRSMIVTSSTALEEWLDSGLQVQGADDIETALERLGLEERFNDFFSRTLNEMGDLTGDEIELANT